MSAPFKSSLFGEPFGFEGLTKTMTNNADVLKTKDMTTRPKSVVSAAMRTAGTREDFTKTLQEKGMDVVFRTNNDGRTYGVTFIDHENRVALNGSRLGKDYSANVFHACFNEGNRPISPQSSKTQNALLQPLIKDNKRADNEPDKKTDTSILEEVFGIFDVKSHSEDYDEIAFARKMRKKKKRRI